MKIKILRKTKFENLMLNYKTTNDNVESFDNMFCISILNPEDKSGYFKPHSNVLVLYFDDITDDLNWDDDDDYYGPTLFTIEQAQSILDFINLHKDKEFCFIHCSAGISRSGAVGTFLNDYLKLDKVAFRSENPQIQPNPFVLKMLNSLI